MSAPPFLPVLAGVGQVSNKDDERLVHPAQLLVEAAQLALDDAGIAAGQVGAVLTTPFSLYSQDRAAEMLAERLDLGPGLRTVSAYSGAAPQVLLAQACRAVARGEITAAIVAGAIADASVSRAAKRGIEPPAAPTGPWSPGAAGLRAGRHRPGRSETPYVAEIAAGAGMPVATFALVESALAGPDLAGDDLRRRLARLLAPFSDVAASRPDLAWQPRRLTAEQIATPTGDNRLVAEPFTKLMCSYPTVDLAAAVVVTNSARSSEPAIRPLAITSTKSPSLPSGWPHMSRPPSFSATVAEGFRLTGATLGDLGPLDLYSCFPTALRLADRALGIDDDDPRSRTLTGGLSYFGGPGASYSLHSLVCMVEALRADPSRPGAIVGVGGLATDYSFGIYGTGDAPFRSAVVEPDPDDVVPTVPVASGPATVEAMTVIHDRRRGPIAAPVIARLADGTRTGARAADPAVAASLVDRTLVGTTVLLSTEDDRVTFEPTGD